MFRSLVRRLHARSGAGTVAVGRHRRPTPTRLSAGAAAVALLLSASAVAALGERSANGATATGTLTKTGVDLTTTSRDTVSGGDTVQYVLSATNDTSSRADVNITDVLESGQTVKTASVSAPPGYRVKYSTDGGVTYSATEPASGVNAIQADGSAVPGSTGAAAAVPVPGGAIKTSTSQGDGYQAIFFNGRIYNVHHHTDAGDQRTIDCHVQATGDPCPRVGGGVWPDGGLSVLSTAGTDLVAAPAITMLSTSNNPFAHLTAAGKLYIPVKMFGPRLEAGLACIDLVAEKSCGYTHVFTPTAPANDSSTTSVAQQGVAGGVSVGDRFYLVGDAGQVYCMNTATVTPTSCGGPAQPFNPAPTASLFYGSASQLRSFDGGAHLYVARPAAQGFGNVVSVGCLVTASLTPCPGFVPPTVPIGNQVSSQLLPVLNAAGDQTGICVSTYIPTESGQCWDASNGSPIPNPYPTGAVLGHPGMQMWGRSGQGTPAVIGTRVYYTAYFGLAGAAGDERYVCHDFRDTDGTVCGGFDASLMAGTPSAPLKAYTLTPDPNHPGCIWEVGDEGIIDALDANTGANAFSGRPVTGCGSLNTEVQVAVSPAAFYCDGSATSHTTSYDELTLTGLPSGYTFSGTLTLTDQNGATLDSRQVDQSSFPLDLSSYQTGGVTTLHAKLQLHVPDSSPWLGAGPQLQVTFTGDAPQVCFKVAVPDNCAQGLSHLDNTAKLRINTVAAADATYSFGTYHPASTCAQPGLTYLKTADKKQARPGESVKYTITVTNSGDTDLPNATFSDDLRDVLLDAEYNGDVHADRGSAVVTGTALTWSGPLKRGEAAVLTYTVTVKSAAPDGATFDNTVLDTTDNVPSNCESTSTRPECAVTVMVLVDTPKDVPLPPPGTSTTPPKLIDTGLGADSTSSGPSVVAVAVGGSLVVGGVALLLVMATLRRRSND